MVVHKHEAGKEVSINQTIGLGVGGNESLRMKDGPDKGAGEADWEKGKKELNGEASSAERGFVISGLITCLTKRGRRNLSAARTGRVLE